MIDSETQKKIRESCLRLLTRREHSQHELRAKLALKGFELMDTQPVIDDLAVQGWQSDQRFTESYVKYRVKKGDGPIKMRIELQQRGIYSVDLDSIILDIPENWTALLLQVYEKKYSNDTILVDKEWLKRCRFLQQRGFNGEMIKQLFQHLNIKLISYKKR